MTPELLLACAFALAAMLYSSVGHGGASGYLAVMALAGFAPSEMRWLALWMNIFVSALGDPDVFSIFPLGSVLALFPFRNPLCVVWRHG